MKPPERLCRPSRSRLSILYGLFALMTLAGLIGCGASGGADQPIGEPDLVQDAKAAFFKLNLKAARSGFDQALAETSLPVAERAEAARRLANIAWRFDQDRTAAEAYLQQAEKLEDSFDTDYERVRLLLSRGQLDEALDAARKASSHARARQDRVLAKTEIGRISWLRRSSGSPDSPQHGRQARAALDRLLPIVLEDPGRLEPARIALGLALQLGDGESALAAWRAYYRVPDALTALPSAAAKNAEWDYPAMAQSHAALSRLLPAWAGPFTPPDDRAAVVRALADSRFFSVAAWTATDLRIPAEIRIEDRPVVRDVVSYNEFLQQVANLTADLYRERALDQTVKHRLRDSLRSVACELWGKLHFADQRPTFRENRFWEEISRRFGAQVYFRTDGGGDAVHLGHRVVDDRRRVEQYGRSTDLRFAEIDALAANGYSSWFWDGQAATGGWVADDGTVVQVRTSYSDGPLKAWYKLTDPQERDGSEMELREKTIRDDEIARRNPYAYLPGLTLRLREQAHRRLYAEFASKGLKDTALKEAFVAELGRRTRASSIFAHEGRHALERRNVPRNWLRSGDQKEFLAKLSEVALAPDPRIAILGGILSANIGDGSSHGQANQRIMKGLVAWMKEHASEIQGLDASRPYLPQFDLLTDDQIRAAFRSLDPWAR